jgi:hypothetical protein
MPRADEEHLLEPILPKHPPYQREGEAVAGEDGEAVEAGPARAGVALGGRSWERWVLLGCAVVAALSLVVVAMRVSEIADHERVQACQARAFAQQSAEGFSGRNSQERFGRELGECVGLDVSETDDD